MCFEYLKIMYKYLWIYLKRIGFDFSRRNFEPMQNSLRLFFLLSIVHEFAEKKK